MTDETKGGGDLPDGDVTDPAYWAQPQFKIKGPEAPVLFSKVSCPICRGASYSDGAGGYVCFGCGYNN